MAGREGRGWRAARGVKARGFSLLEVLFAMVLVATFFAVSLAAYSSLARASALSFAGQQLVQIFQEAHQDAVTQNVAIELRIYEVAPDAGQAAAYCALQIHRLNSDGSVTALAAPVRLPAGVVLDTASSHSPLLGSNTIAATPDVTDPRLNAQTRVVHFLPDGSTDLAATSSWFVTARTGGAAEPAVFPANWGLRAA